MVDPPLSPPVEIGGQGGPQFLSLTPNVIFFVNSSVTVHLSRSDPFSNLLDDSVSSFDLRDVRAAKFFFRFLSFLTGTLEFRLQVS